MQNDQTKIMPTIETISRYLLLEMKFQYTESLLNEACYTSCKPVKLKLIDSFSDAYRIQRPLSTLKGPHETSTSLTTEYPTLLKNFSPCNIIT